MIIKSIDIKVALITIMVTKGIKVRMGTNGIDDNGIDRQDNN